MRHRVGGGLSAAGGDARGFHEAFPFERASGAEAILAYPEGLDATWDLETKLGNRDVEFAAELVEELARTATIDRSRVFGVGYSSGGFLTNVIACQRGGLLRAISSSAGVSSSTARTTRPRAAAVDDGAAGGIGRGVGIQGILTAETRSDKGPSTRCSQRTVTARC